MENTHPCPFEQHVHEILGSTKITGCCEKAHNHRFATVSCKAIPCDDGHHYHEVKFTTDSCDGHIHTFSGKTSKEKDVGCGHHVHFIESVTSRVEEHEHCFSVATLIDNPTCEK
ncbi:MAG: YmaF family protein [Coprococcus sp.]